MNLCTSTSHIMSSYRYVHFWDFVGHSDVINCVALSGDGKKLGSGGMDNKILIWNVDSKALLHSIEANSPVLCMSWIKIIDKDVLFCGTEGGQVLTVSESTAVFVLLLLARRNPHLNTFTGWTEDCCSHYIHCHGYKTHSEIVITPLGRYVGVVPFSTGLISRVIGPCVCG